MLSVIAAVLGILTAVTIPLVVLIGLLAIADTLHRRRLRVIARQVAVTDAIHRAFGAVVAPVVSKRLGGPWTVFIALPPERWALAGSLAAIAHEVVADGNGHDAGIRVVLTLPKA